MGPVLSQWDDNAGPFGANQFFFLFFDIGSCFVYICSIFFFWSKTFKIEIKILVKTDKHILCKITFGFEN